MWPKIKKLIIWMLSIIGALFIAIIALVIISPNDKNNAKPDQNEKKELIEKETGNGNHVPKVENEVEKIKEEFYKKYKSDINKYNEYKDKKVSDIREITVKLAKEISTGFAATKEVPSEYFDSFYRCMGDFARTKSAELPVETILGWCFEEYNRDKEKFKKDKSSYSFYDFINQFSQWDGSHPQSIEVIKRAMNDPDSFDHQETRFRFITKDDKVEAWVITRFTGKNAYGGRVRGAFETRIDPDSGKVLEIKQID